MSKNFQNLVYNVMKDATLHLLQNLQDLLLLSITFNWWEIYMVKRVHFKRKDVIRLILRNKRDKCFSFH